MNYKITSFPNREQWKSMGDYFAFPKDNMKWNIRFKSPDKITTNKSVIIPDDENIPDTSFYESPNKTITQTNK